MSFKYSINSGTRTFYLSANGDDIASGLSPETAVKTIDQAILNVIAVNPTALNPTAIIGQGAGIFVTDNFSIPEGCNFEGPDTTFITNGLSGVTPGDSAIFRIISLVVLTDNASALSLPASFDVGITLAAISCRGENSIGFNLTNTSDTVVFTAGSIRLEAVGAVGISDTNNNDIPEVYDVELFKMMANNTTAFVHNPSLGTSESVLNIGSISLEGSPTGTTGLNILSGAVDCSATHIEAAIAIHVASGATLSITGTSIEGAIIVDLGGILHCEVPDFEGTITNNGEIHGRIGDSIFGAQSFMNGIAINSTTEGFKPPDMTTTQRDAIVSPATGLQIHNLTTEEPEYYTGSAWVSMSGDGDVISVTAGTNLNNSGTATEPVLNLDDTITGSGSGGDLTLKGAASSPNGGDVIITGGPGSNNGGDINLRTGYGSSGNGGNINLTGEEGTNGNGGGFNLTGGNAATDDGTGTGGGFDLTTGLGGYVSGDGGDINLTTGSTGAGTGKSGSITLDIGNDAGGGVGSISLAPTNGTVDIGPNITVDQIGNIEGVNILEVGQVVGNQTNGALVVKGDNTGLVGGNVTISGGIGSSVVGKVTIEGGTSGAGTGDILLQPNAGDVGIGKTPTAKLDVNGAVKVSDDFTVDGDLIFADKSNGTVTLGNATTGTDRFNVYGPGNGLNQGIMSLYNSVGGILFRFKDQITASSIPPRIQGQSNLGLGYDTDSNAPHIFYVNGNEKMRLTSDDLIIDSIATNPGDTLDIKGGDGVAAQSGATVNINSGDGGATSGSGGGLFLEAGSATAATGGSGGTLIIASGDSTGGNSAGTCSFEGGKGGTTGFGGNVQMLAGDGGSTSGPAGDITLTGGDAVSGDSGKVIIKGGTSGDANGGDVTINSGDSDGDVRIQGDGGSLYVGPSANEDSAIFQAQSNTQGLLPPRMSTVQRDLISSPANGLQIYNATTDKPEYFNGSSWVTLVNQNTDYLDFTPQNPNPPYKQARIYYSEDRETLDFYNAISDVTVNLPEESIQPVWNSTGSTITNGQVIKFSGVVTGGIPNIELALADTVADANAAGVATHDIENGTKGYVTIIGSVGGVNTSAFSAGDILFLSTSTAGGLENTEQVILNPIAICLVSDVTDGVILVKPRGVVNITALAQVSKDTGSPTQGINTTLEPVSAYENAALPSLNVTANFTASEGNYECEFQPASIGASGFYRVDFSATCTYSDSKDVIFKVFVNGSETPLGGIMPFASIDPSQGGSVSFSGITSEVIDNTETIEIYVGSDDSSGTLTFASCLFSVTRIGNA